MAEERCVLSDLLPRECACKHHRNSPELPRYYGDGTVSVTVPSGGAIGSPAVARYAGHCLICETPYTIGERLWRFDDVLTDQHGWVCNPCGVSYREPRDPAVETAEAHGIVDIVDST